MRLIVVMVVNLLRNTQSTLLTVHGPKEPLTTHALDSETFHSLMYKMLKHSIHSCTRFGNVPFTHAFMWVITAIAGSKGCAGTKVRSLRRACKRSAQTWGRGADGGQGACRVQSDTTRPGNCRFALRPAVSCPFCRTRVIKGDGWAGRKAS